MKRWAIWLAILIVTCSASTVAAFSIVGNEHQTQVTYQQPDTTYYLALCDTSDHYQTVATDSAQTSYQLVHAHWWLVPEGYYNAINEQILTGATCSQDSNN